MTPPTSTSLLVGHRDTRNVGKWMICSVGLFCPWKDMDSALWNIMTLYNSTFTYFGSKLFYGVVGRWLGELIYIYTVSRTLNHHDNQLTADGTLAVRSVDRIYSYFLMPIIGADIAITGTDHSALIDYIEGDHSSCELLVSCLNCSPKLNNIKYCHMFPSPSWLLLLICLIGVL